MGGNVNPSSAGEANLHMTQLLVSGDGTTVRMRAAEVGAGTSGDWNWNIVPKAICAVVGL